MRFASWAMILILMLCGASACGGASSKGSSQDGDQGDDEDGDAGPEAPKRKKMERPVSDEGKKWGGWRWKGKREDCFFVHENQCFATLADACRAAKCKKDECVHDEGAPAKVSCE